VPAETAERLATVDVGTSEFPAEFELEVESGLFVLVTAGLNNADKDMDRGGLKTLAMLSLPRVAAVDGCALALEEAGIFALFLVFPFGSALLCSLFPALLMIFELDEGSWASVACDNTAANWSGVAAEVAGALAGSVLTAIWGMLTITGAPQAQGESARGGPDSSN
jgi:hypothetical protein